jgi:ABC-2 type transport system ATP-binding protein
MMAQPILSVSGLHKRVGRRLIVRDVSFEVGRGEIFGFLGPNGAGKTTTIRMLVGLIRPTAGRITINGYDLRTSPLAAMRSVGCIVENPDLYPYLTGYENLRQLARMQGQHAVERIDHVAQLVHLSARLHDKVRTYSLGMRQRLGIAQALLGEPKLLILDEPTNGLDPAGIRELRTFLQELSHSGLSIFISSHLLAEVEQLCDRVAIIRDGAVVQTGDVQALIAELSNEINWRVAPADTALPILAKHAEHGNVRPVDDGFRCIMTDEDVSQATLELAGAGCQVYEVSRFKSTLEDVFMKTTGGDTANDFSASRSE